MAEKQTMNIGDVISESFKEFKDNFKVFLKIIIFLSFIPMIVFTIIEVFWLKDFIGLGENVDPSQIVSLFFGPWFYAAVLFFIIFMFLGVWMQASLIYNSLYKKKIMSVKETLDGGKKYFWKFFGLSMYIFLVFSVPILIMVGIIGISIYFLSVGTGNYSIEILAIVLSVIAFIVYLFVIIYMGIRWVFSPFILIGENKRVMDSFRQSREMIRGRWWITFLYVILLMLIIWTISFVISLPGMMINWGINLAYYGSLLVSDPNSASVFTGSFNVFLMTTFVSTIFSMIGQAIIVPLTIFFFKNLYRMRKEEVKANPTK